MKFFLSLCLAAGCLTAAPVRSPILSKRAEPTVIPEETAAAVATRPDDWNNLEIYQETITRSEFTRLLNNIYNPSKTIYAYLSVTDEAVEFYGDKEKTMLDFSLRFAPAGTTPKRAAGAFRGISEMKQIALTQGQPLKGVRIAIDPGHIGGKWAGMEERAVIWGKNPVIREGDKNLQVAQLIKSRLEAAGALVYMTHETPEPVTQLRPSDFLEEARKSVYAEKKITLEDTTKDTPILKGMIKWKAELFFYRRAEIAQRADNIRAHFQPDLNICNHFNATEKSGAGDLVKDNRHAFFINGCYGPEEIDTPATRYYMFAKLLEQPLEVELAVADSITKRMLTVAKLPPVRYGREKFQCRVNDNPYLYARNLAASRQYPGPCVILEPFYMNNPWTAERLAAGDYDGVRQLAGGSYRSLFRDYADAVADGIIEAYSHGPSIGKLGAKVAGN